MYLSHQPNPVSLVALPKILMRLAERTRDVVFHRLGGNAQALPDFLVGALMEYFENERSAALRRQPFNRLPEQP